ncbi:MAG: alpha amylase C-terminal domain-containing protein [Candidatus Gastranaerophilales bacterium]|nr:alpha amylase C-terminal domain-containing protein [Candidatus Gastranaerophilales bacterium]
MKVSSVNNGINQIRPVHNYKPVLSGMQSRNVIKKNNPVPHQFAGRLSNIYYEPVSFGRTKAEHKSWGAVVDPKTKEVSFKILTYPDTKKVTVTIEKADNPENIKTFELKNKKNGIFATNRKISPKDAAHGDKYYYTIYKGNGDIDIVKDPYSFKQDDLLGESTIYDHSLFEWSDDDWFKNNKNRISRKADSKNGLTSLKEARIFEFNTASYTKDGTFKSAKKLLNALPKMGFNAIEIMPVENTYSFNWGYDGVDKFAPSKVLGGSDGLKDLVDYSHSLGLNVIMDMVPNHLGPDGASLLKTGPYISGNNCFGEAFNYEGKDSRFVRDYIVNAALNWLDNYHCDGLRLDMTKFMDSDYTMKQIAAEVNYHKPDAFLIAEDGREAISNDEFGNYWFNNNELHDKRVTTPLLREETGEGKSIKSHCSAIERISNNNSNIGRLGFDSEWDFNFFHTLQDGLYGNVDIDKLEKACYCSQNNVKYVMSHDEIGNFEGSRLIPKLMCPMLHLNDNIELDENDIERAKELSKLKGCDIHEAQRTVSLQKAQFTSEKLAQMLLTGQLKKYDTGNISYKKWNDKVNESFTKEVLKPLGIKESSGLNYGIIKTMFLKSFNINKMAMARTYSIPGPKMIFQGDERADLTPFRFFRQFESVKDETNLYTEKGYKTGIEALNESKMGSIKYSAEGKTLLNSFRNLTRDLNIINSQNPALTNGYLNISETVKHYPSQVIATHAKDSAETNEIYSVSNFNDSDYPRSDAANYYIKFPEGKWQEILNTDDTKYGGSGNFQNTEIIESDGIENQSIKLAGNSTVLFKRINE